MLDGVDQEDQRDLGAGAVPDAGTDASTACTAGSVTGGPRVVSNLNVAGARAWTYTDNARTADQRYAVVEPEMGPGQVSNYLLALDFGLALPPGAVVEGIELAIVRQGFRGLGLVDAEVRLVKDHAVQHTRNAADDEPWTRAPAPAYGGPGDLWSQTWTREEIESPGFGAALAVQFPKAANSDAPQVDAFSLTVHYRTCP